MATSSSSDSCRWKIHEGDLSQVIVECLCNGRIFPLAFGVGHSESNDSWEFFFIKLKKAIRDRDDLTIILDKNEGIQNVVQKVYPNIHHGFACNMWFVMLGRNLSLHQRLYVRSFSKLQRHTL